MKERPTLVSEDSEEEKPVVKASKTRAPSRAQSAKPASSQAKSIRASKSQRQPLFIDSDEDEDIKEDDATLATGIGRADSVVEMGGTRKTANRGKERAASTKRKTPAVVVDDDSDDGATFKAFGARTRTRR